MSYYNPNSRFIQAQSNQNKKILNYRLSPLIGSVVTVFTVTGGVAGQGFTGLLTQVSQDSITLLTSVPAPPTFSRNRRRRQPMPAVNLLGTNTVILLEHITAFSYHYI